MGAVETSFSEVLQEGMPLPAQPVDPEVWERLCQSQCAFLERRVRNGENVALALETLRLIRLVLFFNNDKSVLPRELLQRLRGIIGVAEKSGALPRLW